MWERIPRLDSGVRVDEKVFPTVVAWGTGAPKDGMPPADSYSALDVTTLNTRRTPIQKQPELLLCLVGLSQRYFLGDDVYPIFLYDNDREMDLFNLISAPNPAKVKIGTRPRAAHEVPLLTDTANRVIDMEDTTGASGSSGTPSTVEKSPLDFTDEDLPSPNTEEVGTEEQIQDEVSHGVSPLENPPTTESTIGGKSLATIGKAASSTITPVAQDTPAGASSVKDPDPSSKKTIVAEDPDSERSTSFTSMGGLPRSVYQPGWGVTNSCRLDTPDACQDVQVSTLQAQITGEEKIKAAFEEYKKYEDDRVEQRCAEMDARLDKLSMHFDEELYPHMLTAIAGRHWVIGHDLRLAIMKCGETLELRQVFANVVSVGLVKGMSEGLKHGIEHGKASRDLEAVEAYDLEAHSKYLKALQELKDLKYPNPWAIKEEILLEDAIAANVSRAKKKKKCRVVCRTHGVASTHHARSDGVPVSVPTVAPQGLAILLVDASTQTEISEGEASPRLLRSMSLPAMYNLDWP
ncbi:hypothetical protein Tco_1145321 [Tanacetum coccineum]